MAQLTVLSSGGRASPTGRWRFRRCPRSSTGPHGRLPRQHQAELRPPHRRDRRAADGALTASSASCTVAKANAATPAAARDDRRDGARSATSSSPAPPTEAPARRGVSTTPWSWRRRARRPASSRPRSSRGSPSVSWRALGATGLPAARHPAPARRRAPRGRRPPRRARRSSSSPAHVRPRGASRVRERRARSAANGLAVGEAPRASVRRLPRSRSTRTTSTREFVQRGSGATGCPIVAPTPERVRRDARRAGRRAVARARCRRCGGRPRWRSSRSTR